MKNILSAVIAFSVFVFSGAYAQVAAGLKVDVLKDQKKYAKSDGCYYFPNKGSEKIVLNDNWCEKGECNGEKAVFNLDGEDIVLDNQIGLEKRMGGSSVVGKYSHKGYSLILSHAAFDGEKGRANLEIEKDGKTDSISLYMECID